MLKLTTNLNREDSITIEKSSIITWWNWRWKSSILNSVEIWIYWTVNWTRPKSKWHIDFESQYKAKALTLPLADLIYARFLDKSPIDKKKILLSLIDTKDIQTKLWEYWTWDVETSIKKVNDENKIIKKAVEKTEWYIETLDKLIADKKEQLEVYKDEYETDFDFIDLSPKMKEISNLENENNSIVIEWKSLTSELAEIKEACNSCGQSMPEELINTQKIERDRLAKERKEKADTLRVKYNENQDKIIILKAELETQKLHNAKWDSIKLNIAEQSAKEQCQKDIKTHESNIEKAITELTELQQNNISELSDYCKKDIYKAIESQLDLPEFEIDMSKNFDLTYKWTDYNILSRWQKYICNIYFSKALLEKIDVKILMLDDFEMCQKDVRDIVINDIKDFDYLISIVEEWEITIN